MTVLRRLLSRVVPAPVVSTRARVPASAAPSAAPASTSPVRGLEGAPNWSEGPQPAPRERARPADLLQRHLLCSATQLHDPDDDGRCRDCLKVLGPLDDVCVWGPPPIARPSAAPTDPAAR